MKVLLVLCLVAAGGVLIWSALLSTARAQTAVLEPPRIERLNTERENRRPLVFTNTYTDAAIHYTLDGSDPGRDAGVYLAPIDLPNGVILRARALSGDFKAKSEVFSAIIGDRKDAPPKTLVPVTQNRDWQVYDWAARHAACVALMRERQPEIVMLGDSITHFFGGEPLQANRRRGAASWDRLFVGRRVVNLGYGWDRTENVLWRLRHGEFDSVSPKVVVVMIGTNNLGLNSPEDIAVGIRAICDEIHGRSPKTKILLLGIFPRGAKPDDMRAKAGEVNQLIAQFDGQKGVTYLDLGAKFLEPDGTISPEVMDDYLHPTAKGYALWAEAMAPVLARLLAATTN